MSSESALRIFYLTHDLTDPMTRKRVIMLQDGGALVTLAGFRREATAVENVAGCQPINLGQTHNGNFKQRLFALLREILLFGQHYKKFASTDIIIARNLEMLALGVRARGMCRQKPILIYESLDIHRLLLNESKAGRCLRAIEGWLSRRCAALITSSPAFMSQYFNKQSKVRLPVLLIENKVYMPQGVPARSSLTPREPGPPWRIGWFGAIRCRKSLDILSQLVRQSNGTIEVIIRGKPSLDQIADFEQRTSELTGLRFEGPYKNPEDLAEIYGEVHFTWAIDMFEEGLNSSWLLPNRLYEGGVYASVPIAQANVETGRYLQALYIGVLIGEPKLDALIEFFNTLTPEKYLSLQQSVMRIPVTHWTYSQLDCTQLVGYLCDLTVFPEEALHA